MKMTCPRCQSAVEVGAFDREARCRCGAILEVTLSVAREVDDVPRGLPTFQEAACPRGT